MLRAGLTAPDWKFRSSIPGTIWPAIPDIEASRLLSVQLQFEAGQWWPREQLEHWQLRQAKLSLQHAHGTTRFHRERLNAAGFDPLAELTPESFARLPRMDRGDIQAHGQALVSNRVPAAHGRVMKGETSGSTGRPITHYGTELSQFFWQACTLRDHLWHARDFSKKLAAIRKNLGDAVLPSWGAPADVVFQTGPSATFDISTDLDSQLDWLQRQAPAYLITAAYNLYWLARRSLERDIRLPGLRQVRSYGGTLPEDARDVFRKAWNVPLLDMYTAEEVGYIALQCPTHEHYHVQSENLLIEILDERGEPCRPGEIGRVVLTTLHNFAMPLIRYDIGDYAEAGAPCPCGRGLPVISRILGRQRNILTLPDGRQRWPSFPSEKWSHVAPVRQLQMIQHSRECIEVRVVAERILGNDEKAKLVGALQICLGHPFVMEVTEVDEILRSDNQKFEDFVSDIVG